jgi:hypothetical protein
MTPEQLDHLRAIDAHLNALLDLAAKRTPGEWVAGTETVWAKDEEDERICNDCGGWDPDFIAACAGNAEAGWRATKAAIEDWLIVYNNFNEGRALATCALENILAAWPRELLTPAPAPVAETATK